MMKGMPKPKNVEQLHFKDGDTGDIIAVLLAHERRDFSELCAFAERFRDKDPMRSALKVHNYIVENIKYKADPSGEQWIRTPQRLVADRQGDCKSFTLFTIAIFKCLGIDYLVRFASYDKTSPVTHVYPVALIKGEQIPVDAVLSLEYRYNSFGKEKRYAYKIDRPMTRISTLAGIGNSQSEVAQKIRAARTEAPKKYIPFDVLSEGQARLDLLERQLKLIGVTNDANVKRDVKKGLEMISKAKRDLHKSGSVLSGVIPEVLMPLAAQISEANKLQMSAVQMGRQRSLSGTAVDLGRSVEMPGSPVLLASLQQNIPYYNNDTAPSYVRGVKIQYGKTTEFAVTGTEAYNRIRMAAATFGYNYSTREINAAGKTADDFYRYFRVPVNVKWFNETYQDSIGCGVLYDFIGSTPITPGAGNGRGNAGGTYYSLQQMPNLVQTKALFQNRYNAALSTFSGISPTNINLMARNGVLASTSGQPETIITKLVTDEAGIGELITLIIACVTAIAACIGAIAGSTRKASELDVTDATNLVNNTLGGQQMFATSDWGVPNGPAAGTGAPGSGAGTNTSGAGAGTNWLVPGLLAAGAAAWYFSSDNS
jgi:hypothetical protein